MLKIATTCMQCLVETGAPNLASREVFDMPDEGVIIRNCISGHETATILQNEKYDILYKIGVSAIARQNYRDAISTFASGMERLREYFVIVCCRNGGIDSEIFASTYKIMANLSERQYGAFLATYLLETKTSAPKVAEKWIKLRNKVVHDGKIASREDAMGYCQAALDYSVPILNVLGKNAYKATISKLSFELLRKRGGVAQQKKIPISTLAMGSSFSPNDQIESFSIKDLVSIVEKYPMIEA